MKRLNFKPLLTALIFVFFLGLPIYLLYNTLRSGRLNAKPKAVAFGVI